MTRKTHTLMVVHAHPDDEASSTGGLLRLAADQGHTTIVVTCTHGDLGEVKIPGLRLNPRQDAADRQRLSVLERVAGEGPDRTQRRDHPAGADHRLCQRFQADAAGKHPGGAVDLFDAPAGAPPRHGGGAGRVEHDPEKWVPVFG